MFNLLSRIGISTLLFAAASAQLVIPEQVLNQHPGVIMQPSADGDFKVGPVLSDQLALEPQASIFFSYARESANLSGVLSGLGDGKYTVFVPTNKAVMALARKPHQGSGSSVEDDIEITEDEADRRAAENVEKWVSAHIIPEYMLLSGDPAGIDGVHKTLLDGTSLKLSHDGSRKTLHWHLNDRLEIHGERKASNGVMYLIDGTIEV